MTNNFFIVGVQRCGTTYLYNVLDEHPQIYMARPLQPEPKFFLDENEYQKGKSYYEKKYFSSSTGHYRGEKTTSYLDNKHVADRIKNYYPDAKIIIMLRNPVQRALSNFFFSVQNDLETRSLTDVFIKNSPPKKITRAVSTDPFNYIGRSEYITYLPAFIDKFDKDKVRVIIFENFVGKPKAIQELYSFLGCSKFNSKNHVKVFRKSTNRTPVGNEIIEKLYTHFSQYNRLLAQYLHVDLSCWSR